MSGQKSTSGNFLEDFAPGQVLTHATPRTVTQGDVALYTALYGSRFALQSSAEFARRCGLHGAPVDDWLVFHLVFGKTVPDISLNAVANLGYADGRFGVPVYPGDTLRAVSDVIGIKENSNGKTGVVYVRTRGLNQNGQEVLSYVRWVMVRKRDAASVIEGHVPPELPDHVPADALDAVAVPKMTGFDFAASGEPYCWDEYAVGETIDHMDGMTVEEAEHQLATRLYQNTARVHFNQHTEGAGRFGRRLIYGGHVISLARALSFNGLANAVKVVGLNGGRHVAPLFAGDTVYAWSEVLDKAALPGREDAGLLRLRMIATKDLPCADHPLPDETQGVILDLDMWVAVPR
ncbi:MaoC family dehydratase [Pyruvatibacter mobilis]|uniref:MaoC family dehydratase n=1 Tax=Pyruvatibacter mobilis TaxID=1712261 RepID=UPI003BAB4F55